MKMCRQDLPSLFLDVSRSPSLPVSFAALRKQEQRIYQFALSSFSKGRSQNCTFLPRRSLSFSLSISHELLALSGSLSLSLNSLSLSLARSSLSLSLTRTPAPALVLSLSLSVALWTRCTYSPLYWSKAEWMVAHGKERKSIALSVAQGASFACRRRLSSAPPNTYMATHLPPVPYRISVATAQRLG